MSSFRLHIVTPDCNFYTGDIEYLRINTPLGEEGFLAGALPKCGMLSSGTLEIKTSVLSLNAECGNGLVNVTKDGVTIITERCKFVGQDDETKPGDEYEKAADQEYRTAKVQLAAKIKDMRKGSKSDAGK